MYNSNYQLALWWRGLYQTVLVSLLVLLVMLL